LANGLTSGFLAGTDGVAFLEEGTSFLVSTLTVTSGFLEGASTFFSVDDAVVVVAPRLVGLVLT
jgi:hypothetical protein